MCYRPVQIFPLQYSIQVVVVVGDGANCFFLIDKCRIGLGICYDIRFSEMAVLHAKKGIGWFDQIC